MPLSFQGPDVYDENVHPLPFHEVTEENPRPVDPFDIGASPHDATSAFFDPFAEEEQCYPQSAAPFPTPEAAMLEPTPVMVKPKRPLSAYNFFFRDERKNILATRLVGTEISAKSTRKGGHGKIGFSELGKTVSARWKVVSLPRLEAYRALAKQEKLRYKTQMAEYKKYQETSELERRPSLPVMTLASNPAFYPTSSAKKANIEAGRIHELAIKLGPEEVDFLIRALRK